MKEKLIQIVRKSFQAVINLAVIAAFIFEKVLPYVVWGIIITLYAYLFGWLDLKQGTVVCLGMTILLLWLTHLEIVLMKLEARKSITIKRTHTDNNGVTTENTWDIENFWKR